MNFSTNLTATQGACSNSGSSIYQSVLRTSTKSYLSQSIKSKLGHKEEHENQYIWIYKVGILFKYFAMYDEARNSLWYAGYSGKSPIVNATFSKGQEATMP